MTAHQDITEEEIERVQQDGEWYQENYDSLCSNFPGQFVAIHNEHVIAAAGTRSDLRDELQREAGLVPQRTLVEYVPKESQSLQMVRNVPRD